MLFLLFNNLDWLTRRCGRFFPGCPGLVRSTRVRRRSIHAARGFYFVATTVFLVVFVIQYAIVHSDFGRSLAAIRQDEIPRLQAAASTFFAHKLMIFGVGGNCRSRRRTAGRVSARGRASIVRVLEDVDLVLIASLSGAPARCSDLALARCCLSRCRRHCASLTNSDGAVRRGLLALALFAPGGLWGLVFGAHSQASRRESA